MSCRSSWLRPVLPSSPLIPTPGWSAPQGPWDRSPRPDSEGAILTVGGALVGTGTVRSYFIQAPAHLAEWPAADDSIGPTVGLAAMMATGDPRLDGDTHVLPQGSDPALNNSIDVVHGGIASAGLEVVASAAVNSGRADDTLTTASLRVNFLRQFFAGGESRYVGTALRVGRRSGVADAQAIGSDGRVAIIARLTAYRS